MIPLRDTNPHRTFPIVNYFLIGANVIIFLLQILSRQDRWVVIGYPYHKNPGWGVEAIRVS